MYHAGLKYILKRSDGYIPIVLVLLSVCVFYPVIGHDFVDYDDVTFVVRNPDIQRGFTFEGIVRAFTSAYEANWIPLTWISHMLDVQLFGLNPAGHHLTNLLLHIFNTLLLYAFFKRATGAAYRSAAVALLFAVHPLHVESVAWVAERKDVLSAFFWMLTMCAYLRYASNPNRTRYLMTLGLFIMGLLSKPMLVTLPVVLLLLDWWPLRRITADSAYRNAGGNRAFSRLIVEKIPFFVFSIVVGIITLITQRADISNNLSFAEKAVRAFTAYSAYLGKMLWPDRLAVIYPFSVTPPSVFIIVLSSMLLIIITFGAVALRRSAPYLITGWIWYVVVLLPVIGLIHIGHHSIADRYTYIPLIGIFVAIVWGMCDVFNYSPSYRKVVIAVLFVIVSSVLLFIARAQVGYWKNGITLFTHAIEVTENNWIAHNNLGKLILDQGRIDDAISHFAQSLDANPSYALAHLNMGFALYYKYKFADAERSFENALITDPSCHPAHLGLGLVYLAMGKMDKVHNEYDLLLRLDSGYASELMSAIIDYNNLVKAERSIAKRPQ